MTGGELLTGHRFRVRWDGHDILGVRRVSRLETGLQGATPSPLPVTLERSAGTDADFETWATGAWAGTDAVAQQKDVELALFDLAGRPAVAYHLLGCVPTSWSPLSDLDAGDVATPAVETLVLSVQRIVRDTSVG